ACARYLAYELGPKGIRVHAISPGPLKTRAASGLKDFDLLLTEAAQRAPLGELVDIMDVGFTCAFLATPYARRLSGETLYIDGGVHIMALCFAAFTRLNVNSRRTAMSIRLSVRM